MNDSNFNLSEILSILKTVISGAIALIIFTTALHAQEGGSVLSLGVSQLNIELEDDIIQLSGLNQQMACIGFEAITSKGFAGKIQVHHSLQKGDTKYWDARLSGIYLIKLGSGNGGARFSIPITVSGMYFKLDDVLNDPVGNYGFGGQIGFRAYLTQTLAVEAHYGKNIYAVTRIGDKQFEESATQFRASQISVGVSYFITK